MVLKYAMKIFTRQERKYRNWECSIVLYEETDKRMGNLKLITWFITQRLPLDQAAREAGHQSDKSIRRDNAANDCGFGKCL